MKDELGCVKAQEFNDRKVGNALCGGGRVGVVNADWENGVGPVFQRWRKWRAEVERGLPRSRLVASMVVESSWEKKL